MAADGDTSHERRLLEGMAEAITEKGYAATTIADVVRHSHVSKRTFYEHFADKEEAFLATYSAAGDELLGVIGAALVGEAPWRERLRAALAAYLEELAAHPALTRTFLVEIQAAGPRATALRREVMRRFADGLRAIVDDVRREDPSVAPLSADVATAAVGGINELILGAVEDGRIDALPELLDVAAEFLGAVFEGRRSG
jgi:AcrR family transcriptional regulator